MILDLKSLKEKYNLDINGIIHIGAHYGEEDQEFITAGVKSIAYIEPIKESFEILKTNTGKDNLVNREYFNLGLGNFTGRAIINLSSNRNESASILTPKTHLQLHPWVEFKGTEDIEVTKLDLLALDSSNYNMIVIDVQGYELEVFKGALETLPHIDYIITELNRGEVYENCSHVDDISEFLYTYGFKLAEVNWAGDQWGDGIYIKN